jgi:hypothetical protein
LAWTFEDVEFADATLTFVIDRNVNANTNTINVDPNIVARLSNLPLRLLFKRAMRIAFQTKDESLSI